MDNLIARAICPGCEERKCVEIFSCDFLKDPIKKYINRKFSETGINEYLEGASYTLHECNNCTLIFQHKILNDVLANKMYDEWLNRFDPDIPHGGHRIATLEKLSYYAQEIVKVIVFLKKDAIDIDMLDYGMGWGRWCYMAKAYGCNSFGLDLSTARVEHGRAEGITVIGIDDLNKHQFDFINMEQVVEHLPYPLKTLTTLTKFLKPGGLIKISVPNGKDVKKRLKIMDWTAPRNSKRFLIPATPLVHINTFNHKSVIAMAAKAGLEHVNIPMKCEYALTHNYGIGQAVKNILRPMYRRLTKYTYLFFRKKNTPERVY